MFESAKIGKNPKKIMEDRQAWVVVGQHGYHTTYFNKDEALDQVRRTDRLYSCRMVDWVDLG